MNIGRLEKINDWLKVICFVLWIIALITSVACIALGSKGVEAHRLLILSQMWSFSVAVLLTLIRLHIVDEVADGHREAAGVLATYIVDKYVEEEEEDE